MATKTRTRAPKVLSFDAVDAYLIATTPAPPFDDPTAPERLGCWHAARRIGCLPGRSSVVVPRTIDKWRAEGLDVWQADRIACALGMEPDDERLWGREWREHADAAVEAWLAATGEPWDLPGDQQRLAL